MSREEEYNPVSAEETYTHLKHEIHRLRSQVKYRERITNWMGAQTSLR